MNFNSALDPNSNSKSNPDLKNQPVLKPHSDLKNQPNPLTQSILHNLRDFVYQYQNYSDKDSKPSGADLVAQICGGLCWYDGMNFTTEKLLWPFPDYELFVFHTGNKLATHEHLKSLTATDLKVQNLRPLIPVLLAARTALDQANLRLFCQALNDYYDILGQLHLSDSKVRQSVHKLRQSQKVLAAKGCGAMGVDTLIIMGLTSDGDCIKSLCQQQNFAYITCLSQSHQGATMRRPH